MNKSPCSTDMKYICQLLFQTFELHARFLDKEKNIICEYIYNDIANPFYSSKKEQINDLFLDNDPTNFPVIRTNVFLENFILIHVANENIVQGTFIIGPTLNLSHPKNGIDRILDNTELLISKGEVTNYYQSLPTIKKSNLIQVSVLLYYLIYSEKIEASTIERKNITFKGAIEQVENPDLFVSIRHQNHHECANISIEIQIFEAIKSGNKEKLLKYVELYPDEKTGILCLTSELRNRKNQGIIGIAQAARYAIDGGLPSDIAFSLSDLYIQNLEKLNDVTSVLHLIIDAFCNFADYVKKYVNQNLSKTIMDCKNYISKNIYRELSLEQLAHITNKNHMYLSTLFKKEIGVPLSEYIQREKVAEAKKLLTLTDYSLLEISTLLNFNNQSYFTKIFKKYTDITPKQYREQYTKC